MGIIDQKSEVFGKIAAARTVAEGLPKLVTNPSFPSINNDGDSVAFLVDLLKSLVGLERLREVIVDTFTYQLGDIEKIVKTSMKQSLKSLVNCGVNPSTPSFLKSTGGGVTIETNKIDFFNTLKTDPNTPEGNLLYTDTTSTPLTNSTDYNTFLYGTIQNDGTTETWSGLLDVRFDSTNLSSIPNNTLTFNTNPTYDSKTLTDLNNDFIDSINLFDSKNLLNKLLDDLFGSLSIKLNKTTTQLQKEEQINTIIKHIVNADENDVIDDSFFTFSNEVLAEQENSARWRRKGIRVIDSCGSIPVSISNTALDFVNSQLTGATTTQDKKEAFTNAIRVIGGNIGNNATNVKDSYALELNFIENLIYNLIVAIVGFVLSPKVISIFLINYKIVYGITEGYDDAVDFIKQNKNLLKDITKVIKNAIISVLLNTVLKEVSNLVSETIIEIETEKAKNKLAQVLSLVGVPQEVIRIIKNI